MTLILTFGLCIIFWMLYENIETLGNIKRNLEDLYLYASNNKKIRDLEARILALEEEIYNIKDSNQQINKNAH